MIYINIDNHSISIGLIASDIKVCLRKVCVTVYGWYVAHDEGNLCIELLI